MNYGKSLKKKRPMMTTHAPKGKTSGLTRQNMLTEHRGASARVVPPPDKGPVRSGITRQANLERIDGDGHQFEAPDPDPGPGTSGLDAQDNLSYVQNSSQRGMAAPRVGAKIGTDLVAKGASGAVAPTMMSPFKKKGAGGSKNRRFRRR